MKITSLGHGGAFAGIDKGNTSFLLEDTNPQIPGSTRRLLFDCGTLTPYILRDELGISFQDIDAVYISHNHADHVGGLPLFLQSRYWIPKTVDGKKILPKIGAQFLVWKEIGNQLDREVKYFKEREYFALGDFCSPIFDWVDGQGFNFGPWSARYITQRHIAYGPKEEKPVFGLSILIGTLDKGYKKVLFTADTADVADLGAYDIVFHDCETSVGFKSGVHAHYEDIVAAYEKLDKKPQMYMVHYSSVPENPHPDFNWFAKGTTIEL